MTSVYEWLYIRYLYTGCPIEFEGSNRIGPHWLAEYWIGA